MSYPTQQIHRLRYQLQMPHVHAQGVVAQVVHLLPRWDPPVLQPPRDAVRIRGALAVEIVPTRTVPVRLPRSLPRPAFVRPPLVNLDPELPRVFHAAYLSVTTIECQVPRACAEYSSNPRTDPEILKGPRLAREQGRPGLLPPSPRHPATESGTDRNVYRMPRSCALCRLSGAIPLDDRVIASG